MGRQQRQGAPSWRVFRRVKGRMSYWMVQTGTRNLIKFILEDFGLYSTVGSQHGNVCSIYFRGICSSIGHSWGIENCAQTIARPIPQQNRKLYKEGTGKYGHLRLALGCQTPQESVQFPVY